MITMYTVKVLERDKMEWTQCMPYTTRKKCEDKIATLSINTEYRLESRATNKKQTVAKDTIIIQCNHKVCLEALDKEIHAIQAIKNYTHNIETLKRKRAKCKTIEEITKKDKQIAWCKNKMEEYKEVLQRRG